MTPLIPLIPIEEEEAEDLDNAKTLFGPDQSMQQFGSLGMHKHSDCGTCTRLLFFSRMWTVERKQYLAL